MNLKEEKALRGMISNGTKFDSVRIKQIRIDQKYTVIFILNGTEFHLCSQIRADRIHQQRSFKVIESALNAIKKTGFKGAVVIVV